MNNHTYFNSFLFHSTYMPKNQWYKKNANKSKSRKRERDNDTKILMWKTSEEIKKP